MLPYLEEIINQVSKELGIPYEVCSKAYMSQWFFIEEKVKQHNYKDLTLEEFKQIRPNFNLPSLGKLCVTEERFEGVLKAIEYRKKAAQRKEQQSIETTEVISQDVQD